MNKLLKGLNMNVLVSGATGFIGTHLCKKLLQEKFSVHVVIRQEKQVSEMESRGYHPFFFDGDCKKLSDYLESHKIYGIIHLAAYVLPVHQPEDIEGLIDSNILLGTKLLESAVSAKTRWFLNTGTFWQHYNNEMYSPVNLYAATKQAFEVIAKFYTETSNLIFVTIKLSDTFGPGDPRPKIFNLWQKAIAHDEVLAMTPGEQVIDISYIDNVVEAYFSLIRSLNDDNAEKFNNKSFAVYADERMTLKELAKLFEDISGQPLQIDWSGKPYRVREVMMPQNRLPQVPNFKNSVSVRSGIEKILRKKMANQ
jgi:nucleoside-diphosphate-sugar epimerase